MVVYGMLYKRGHKRKNWQMRLFVLDGSTCKYYELGNTEMKGSFELAQVRSIRPSAFRCVQCKLVTGEALIKHGWIQIVTTEKNVDLASKGKLKKLAGADDQVSLTCHFSLDGHQGLTQVFDLLLT